MAKIQCSLCPILLLAMHDVDLVHDADPELLQCYAGRSSRFCMCRQGWALRNAGNQYVIDIRAERSSEWYSLRGDAWVAVGGSAEEG